MKLHLKNTFCICEHCGGQAERIQVKYQERFFYTGWNCKGCGFTEPADLEKIKQIINNGVLPLGITR